jgi:hypothetical protein
MTNQSKFAWPEKQYNGNTAGYEEHETDQETWLIDKGYDEYMRQPDPRSIPRVREDYRVRRADDPSGLPVGTWVNYESRDSYKRRCDRWVQKGMKIWAKALRGYTGQARSTALLAPKHDPKALFAIIRKVHGDKSEKQVTKLVRKFIAREKSPAKDIEVFNQEWSDSVRIMRANGMDLPEKFLINLYLIALGPKYNTFETVVNVLPAAQRNLVTVMARAVDHSTETDEADNRAHALIVQLQSQVDGLKRDHDSAFAAAGSTDARCTVCNRPYHTKEECFAPGGGLSHLNRKERHEFLEQKRQRRTERAPPASQSNKIGSAAMAQQPNAEIDALTREVQEKEDRYDTLKDRVQSILPGFDFS